VYGLTPEDLELQARARGFADELILHEQYAEEHDGELPDDVQRRLEARAVELGLTATNIPVEHGGRGCSTIQQVLVQEQGGRVTNALAWCLTTPPGWWPAVANDHQREHFLVPTIQGRREECYAITEEYAGSDVSDLKATAARDGDDYLLNGVKWHVTSFNKADYVFFQGVLTTGGHAGSQALFVVDKDAPGISVVRTPAYSPPASTPASRRCSSSTAMPRGSAWCAPRRTPTPSPTTTRSWPSTTCASLPRS
jgi:alkylation response protein AidB-like acyl-CoA dehydrogenase